MNSRRFQILLLRQRTETKDSSKNTIMFLYAKPEKILKHSL